MSFVNHKVHLFRHHLTADSNFTPQQCSKVYVYEEMFYFVVYNVETKDEYVDPL